MVTVGRSLLEYSVPILNRFGGTIPLEKIDILMRLPPATNFEAYHLKSALCRITETPK